MTVTEVSEYYVTQVTEYRSQRPTDSDSEVALPSFRVSLSETPAASSNMGAAGLGDSESRRFGRPGPRRRRHRDWQRGAGRT